MSDNAEPKLTPGAVVWVSAQPDPVAIARAQVFAIVWGLCPDDVDAKKRANWAAEEFTKQVER